jgi:hypothetical protein
MILPLFFSVLFFAVILKHRKNAKSNQQSFSTARYK